MTEFNLSDKRELVRLLNGLEREMIPLEDVKEFIRRLKNALDLMNDLREQAFVTCVIDKLAGEKLI